MIVINGEYPVIINGEQVGTLSVYQEGLMTVFHAKAEDSGELVRLSVYGECEGYLGVMMPGNGILTLKKRLSRAAFKGFPKEITHAGCAGKPSGEIVPYEPLPTPELEPPVSETLPPEPSPGSSIAQVVPIPEPEPCEPIPEPEPCEPIPEPEPCEPIPEPEPCEPLPTPELEPPVPETLPEPSPGSSIAQVVPIPEPEPLPEIQPYQAALEPEESDTIWRRSTNGILLSDDGQMAVPAQTPGIPREMAIDTRVIEGVEYDVFKSKFTI